MWSGSASKKNTFLFSTLTRNEDDEDKSMTAQAAEDKHRVDYSQRGRDREE